MDGTLRNLLGGQKGIPNTLQR